MGGFVCKIRVYMSHLPVEFQQANTTAIRVCCKRIHLLFAPQNLIYTYFCMGRLRPKVQPPYPFIYHFSQNGYLFSILLWEVLLGDIGFYGYLTLRYDTLIWQFISQLFVCFPWNKLNFGVDRALLWTRKSRISWDREMSSWSNSYSLAKTPSG